MIGKKKKMGVLTLRTPSGIFGQFYDNNKHVQDFFFNNECFLNNILHH